MVRVRVCVRVRAWRAVLQIPMLQIPVHQMPLLVLGLDDFVCVVVEASQSFEGHPRFYEFEHYLAQG